MEIEVRGHSGCKIELRRDGKRLILIKSTDDPSYVDRLKLQASKQERAYQHNGSVIKIPKIIEVKAEDKACAIYMEYVYSKNFVEYFDNSGVEEIELFINTVKEFIKCEIDESLWQVVDSSIISNKFDEVAKSIGNNKSINSDLIIQKILEESKVMFKTLPPNIVIPIGACHGDLTFSNMLFNGSNYYLIDFLDSFIESPLLDMVKIRQDSAYMWSVLMYNGGFDEIRMKIICKRIDQELTAYFEEFEWFKNYYHYFQRMNMLRILQYAHEPKVISFLKDALLDMIS